MAFFNGPLILTTIGSILLIIATLWSSKLRSDKDGENAKLQTRIADLSQQMLVNLIGSPDGYAQVVPQYGEGDPVVENKDAARFFIMNPSDYPMIDVSVSVFNVSERENMKYHSRFAGTLLEHTGIQDIRYIGS